MAVPCSVTAPTGALKPRKPPLSLPRDGRAGHECGFALTQPQSRSQRALECCANVRTARRAKRGTRCAPCRRAACLGRRHRRVDQSSGPSESRRGHPQHAVGKPRSPRECHDDARWVGVESTSADKMNPTGYRTAVIRQRLRQGGRDVHSSCPPHAIMSDFLAQCLIAEFSPFRS